MTTPIAGGERVMVERPELRGYGVEWADENRLIVSKRNVLFEVRGALPPRRIAQFPQPVWRRTASAHRLGQRALRFMFYNVLPLSNGDLFVTFGRDIAIVRNGGAVDLVRGMARPVRVLRGGCALARDGSILFGEYLSNVERGPIRLYRYWPGSDAVEVAHTFPAGAIRHVHGVYTDPFTRGQWCLAGDVGDECRILYSEDGFRTHDVVGSGDESWRAVSVQFAPDAVYYGMDAEFTANFIFRIDRRTGKRDVVHKVEGPVYYSSALEADLFFATSAEGCPSQKGNDFAAVWHVDGVVGTTNRLGIYHKDAMSVRYFMPGTIDFARGDGTRKEVLFRTTSLVPDNTVFAIR